MKCIKNSNLLTLIRQMIEQMMIGMRSKKTPANIPAIRRIPVIKVITLH